MSKQLVSIFTANSNSGSACVKELFEKYPGKVEVRGVFRSSHKARPFAKKYPTLQCVVGCDACEPESLPAAFENAESAVIVTPHVAYSFDFSKDAIMTETMIQAAVNAGVKYIIVVGSFTANHPQGMSLIASRFLGPEALLKKLGQEKGIKWTVLRGGYFMENFPRMLKESIRNDSSINFLNIEVQTVDTKDIGKCAAVCLVEGGDKHHGKCYEMSGPVRIGGKEMAATLSKALNKEITYKPLPKEAIEKMPAAFEQIYGFILEKGNDVVPLSNDVKSLTGQNGTFEQFVQDHLDEFD